MTLPAIAHATIGAATVETVNARELHTYLENRDHFATWIKDRVRVYGFTEHVDFTTYSAVSEKGGRPSIEYAITLDTAKELAMVERTDRGREARRYFIECERRAKGVHPAHTPAIPQTYAEALQAAADLARQVETQRAEIAVLAPRSEALATLAETVGSFCTRDAAKALQATERALRSYLAANGWIYRREPGGPWCARSERLSQGWMVTRVVAVETGTGKPWNRPQARITSRGLAVLAMRLGKRMPPEAMTPPGPLFPLAPARA